MKKKHVRVLVVEDESLIALNMQRVLGEFGYVVTSVTSSGEEAIHLVEKEKPDIILMDIQLSGDMNGLETAEQIRKYHDIPIIYVTANEADDMFERAKLADSFGYILKPFQAKEIYSTVEIALYKHRMEQQLRETNLQLEREIEARKKREDELEQYRRHLEQLVEARTGVVSKHHSTTPPLHYSTTPPF